MWLIGSRNKATANSHASEQKPKQKYLIKMLPLAEKKAFG